jgi:hypothetical protein
VLGAGRKRSYTNEYENREELHGKFASEQDSSCQPQRST